jgi:hypothetical protein
MPGSAPDFFGKIDPSGTWGGFRGEGREGERKLPGAFTAGERGGMVRGYPWERARSASYTDEGVHNSTGWFKFRCDH